MWELFTLLGGLLLAIGIIYLVVGLLADYFVERLSPKAEARITSLIGKPFQAAISTKTDEEKKLQEIVDRLGSHFEEQSYAYDLHIFCTPDVDALALPGGIILIFKGLLDQVKSENELAMILGHEIGHFQNRDHLRGLGRGLVLVTVLSGLGSTGQALGSMLNLTTHTLTQRFSQEQETAADGIGAELLAKEYGHVGGFQDFFVRLMDVPLGPSGKEHPGKLRSWFSSHPHPETRIESLKELKAEQGWTEEKLLPLPKLEGLCSESK